MKYSPLLDAQNSESQSLTFCCGLIRQKRHKQELKDTHISDILDRLHELERAQTLRENMLWSQYCEKRNEALQAKKQGDLDGARHHTRLCLQLKAKRQRILLKKENLIQISEALQTAHSNAVMAHTIKESNATLEGLMAATPNLDDLMDRLKDNLEMVEEGNQLLSEPVFNEHDVDEELTAMMEQRNEEESLRLDLPDAPKGRIKEEESPKIKMPA